MTDAALHDNATPPPKRPAGFTYAPGSQPLPGYVIKRGLGEGGFGEVYYALSDAGKEVALKVIRRHLDIELRGVSQCLNLKHPNLVALYDVRVDADGNHWIVMEYVAGERLCDALTTHPQGLPLEEALNWFRGIAAGVEYLHQNGIVHRDLKPANLFRENGVVKIGDYGLSKFISASRRSGHTESVGTVHYMAPEISGGRYGKEIDVYSLGVILCEMLTGRVPFDGESVGEILMKHLTSEPDLSRLAEPYHSAIAAALEKDPALRPKSINEFVRMVEGTTPTPPIVRLPPAVVARPIVRPPEPAPTMAHPAAPPRSSAAWKWLMTGAALFVFFFIVSTWIYARRVQVDETVTFAQPTKAVSGLEVPQPYRTPNIVVRTNPAPVRAWSVIPILSWAVIAVVAASFWFMRRMIAGGKRWLTPTTSDAVVPTVVTTTWREFATDLTGSWLVLFVASAVVSRLLLLIQGGKPEFEQIVWTAATTFVAAALVALVEKWPGKLMYRRHGRRVRYGLLGAGVGAFSWLLADYLRLQLPSEFGLSSIVGIDVWPECYVDGRPTWPAFVGYFGLTFAVLDWYRAVDVRRATTWRFTDAAVAVFWAGAVHQFFPFPQLWGVLVVAGAYLTLPFVFPIADRSQPRPAMRRAS